MARALLSLPASVAIAMRATDGAPDEPESGGSLAAPRVTFAKESFMRYPTSFGRADHRPARILLAEDERELRSLIATALREDGFEIVEAEDGSALLDHVANTLAAGSALEPFDLILSDIRMPGFNALDVLVGARSLLERTPVVLMTAFGDRKTHERARNLGVSAVFDKPFDVDDLRTAICHLLLHSERTRPRDN